MKLVLVGIEKPHWNHNGPMMRRVGFFPFLNRFVDKPTEDHHRKKDDKLLNKTMHHATHRKQMFTLLAG